MVCKWCGIEFAVEREGQVYCSNRCRTRADKKRYWIKYPEKFREQRKRWRIRHKDEIKEYQKDYYKLKHPERLKAHWRANSAVKWNLIDKKFKCEDCGVGGKLHKHHNDYTKGREVEWLCARCHSKRHPKKRLQIVKI